MSNTNSWLCIYAIAQLGKPYWYGTSGQISSIELYTGTTQPALKRDNLSFYTNYNDQLGVKVHDCSGLILGALTCTDVDVAPSLPAPIIHQAEAQYRSNCTNKSPTIGNFPKIPGTLVFHTNSKGIKNHEGVYVGKFIDKDGNTHENAVVEAMGHQYGVTTSLITDPKWDSWGQLDCCNIDTTIDVVFDARTTVISNVETTAVSINTASMRPFVATVTPYQYVDIDYNQIKNARISAMMFFGGELYDASHREVVYRNPHLSKLVSACNNAGLPYALYVNIRARNAIEADKECKVLYYVISEFSPKLGLWLSLQNNNATPLNNDILEIYYRYIDRWGLKARCGLYLTKDQLSKITWNRFKDRFYLWLIDPMKVEDVDDELLQPEIFEVPD